MHERQDLGVVDHRVEAARHCRQIGNVPRAHPTFGLRGAVTVAFAKAIGALQQRFPQLLALSRAQDAVHDGVAIDLDLMDVRLESCRVHLVGGAERRGRRTSNGGGKKKVLLWYQSS